MSKKTYDIMLFKEIILQGIYINCGVCALANFKINAAQMDEIISKAIASLDAGKKEIYDIAENARKESKRLEEELHMLKTQVKEVIDKVNSVEGSLKESKKRLAQVSKKYENFSQEEIRRAYEEADNLRIELAIKREQEQYLIRRRNDLEVRIKESYKTIEKAESLVTHIGVAFNYLTGDLKELTLQLEDLQQRQFVGLKIIKAQEEERKRVARDIHDGPAQSMSNVVLKAELCERLIHMDIERAKEQLQQLKHIVRESLQDVRKIIYNLRPMSLDDLGLVPTLQRYLVNFQEETGIQVCFKTRGECDVQTTEITVTVFRIIQEAVSNTFKHAKANSIIVGLEFLKTHLKLFVYDDGVGFDTSELKNCSDDMESGFGLFNMRERVELLNGNLEISSNTGKGTRLNITIPLMAEEGVPNE